MALNASGAFQSLFYDGWLLGHRPGPTKRLRCINPTYRSSLPLERKLAYCTDFYRTAGLPAIFRMLPFAQPVALDAFLAERGLDANSSARWCMRAGLAAAIALPAPAVEVELVAMTAWVEATRALARHSERCAAAAARSRRELPVAADRCAGPPRRRGRRLRPGESRRAITSDYSPCTRRRRCAGKAWGARSSARFWPMRSSAARASPTCRSRRKTLPRSRFTAGSASTTAYDYWYRARPDEQH